MDPLFFGVLAFAFSQVLLSVLLLVSVRRQSSTEEWLLFLFLISVIAYLLNPVIEGHQLASFVRVVENCLPGLFWLFCCRLFDDRFRLSAGKCALVAATVLVPLVGRWLVSLGFAAPDWLYHILPQTLEFVLLGWALFVVIRYWRDDLIEVRRELRFWFCITAGVYTFVLITLREIFFPEAEWLMFWQYIPVAVISLVTNLLLTQLTPRVLHYSKSDDEPADEKKPQVPTVEVPVEVVNQLNVLMLHQHAYREIGLTIGQLAEKLELPEYRLRKMINAGMGFRNFNDYLNGFRVKEAGQRLADSEQNGVAVLSIALDSGFRSLSSFNKAFRDAYGMTPTKYRQNHTSDKKKS